MSASLQGKKEAQAWRCRKVAMPATCPGATFAERQCINENPLERGARVADALERG